jgi:hypothetical protein
VRLGLQSIREIDRRCTRWSFSILRTRPAHPCYSGLSSMIVGDARLASGSQKHTACEGHSGSMSLQASLVGLWSLGAIESVRLRATPTRHSLLNSLSSTLSPQPSLLIKGHRRQATSRTCDGAKISLHIQPRLVGVRLDEAPARGHARAHQHVEGAVGLRCVLDADTQDRAVGRVHGGLP